MLFFAGHAAAANRTVCASGCAYTNLQAAIDAAQPGDTILLRAGQTFIGNYVLKAKSGTSYITIRSDAPDSSLPAAGVRLVPSTRTGGNTSLSSLARLRGQGGGWKSTPVIRTENGAHHYRLQFLEIDGKNQQGYETLIALGNNTSQTSTSLAPYALTLDRMYIHGDPIRGQKRCLALDSKSTDILNSYFEDCKHFASDAQAIAGFNGPGPFRIDNNYLQASTENVLFGGSDPKIQYLVPSDITLTRNLLTKPLSWRNPILAPPASPRASASSATGVLSGTQYFKVVALLDSGGSRAYSAPSAEVSVSVSSGHAATLSWSAVSGATGYRIFRGRSPGGESVFRDTGSTSTTYTYTGNSESSALPPKSGTLWNVKNTIELKNAQRVRIEGNIIEYIWRASQNGYALVFTPRNQGNTAPWTIVQDVTVRSNIIRHINGAVNILGWDYSSSTGSQLTRRITIANNVFDDVDGGKWGGDAYFIVITGGPSNITIDHNTVFHTSTAVFIDGAKSQGFVFTNNLMKHNTYGIFGSGSSSGNATLAAYFPSAVVKRNVLAGGPASSYPPDNFFPSVTTFWAQFVDYSAGNYALVSGSLYIGKATDGKNIGVDLAALSAARATGTSSTVSVTNAAPTASPGGPYSGQPGTAIAFNGTASRDPDGSIASYRWEWGDGTAAGSGSTPTHTYASAGTYTVRLTVTDNTGATGTATTTATVQTSATSSTKDIVLTAKDVTVIHGNWARISSTSGAGGQIMSSSDHGTMHDPPLASPADYFEAPFMAAANTNYHLWLRLRAQGNSIGNDSVWVQFTGAVDDQNVPKWRTGTTKAQVVDLRECSGCGVSGWGWQDRAYWVSASAVRFQSSGPQTVRVQVREDGVQVDEIVLSPVTYASSAPGSATNDGTILPASAATLAAKDIVLRADDNVVRKGNWVVESDSSAVEGRRLGSANLGWSSASTALASPPNYVELTFTAVAGVPYRTWLRLSAASNSTSNNSVWVQYDGSVDGSQNPINRIGSTSGVLVDLEACSGCGMSSWGWMDRAWWTSQTSSVTFQRTGTQRIRIQTREDGVRIDQIVISPQRYLSQAPGAVKNDRTIVHPDGTISTY